MWYELYQFMDFLNRKIEKYPNENYFTVEMNQDLYDFGKNVHFISNGYISFKDKTFVLG